MNLAFVLYQGFQIDFPLEASYPLEVASSSVVWVANLKVVLVLVVNLIFILVFLVHLTFILALVVNLKVVVLIERLF